MLVWYFGSLDTRALPEFAFTLYDTDNDGALSAVRIALARFGQAVFLHAWSKRRVPGVLRRWK